MKKKLEKALEEIKKTFGEGAIQSFSEEDTSKMSYDVIRTGSFQLDRAIGIGGIPKGRTVEIFGPESSGKSTLTLHIIANCQKKGGFAVLIDTEHAFDPKYAQTIGVSLEADKFRICQPDVGEDALEIVNKLVEGGVDLIVVDSVAGLLPQKEDENPFEKDTMGLQARLMSKAMRKLTHKIQENNVALVFTNQVRAKFGVRFGDKTTTPGGRALKFFASLRIFITRIGTEKVKGVKVSNLTKVVVKKNKCAPPYRECEFSIVYGKGIDQKRDFLETLLNLNVLKREKRSFVFEDFKFSDPKNFFLYLKKNPQIKKTLFKKLRKI